MDRLAKADTAYGSNTQNNRIALRRLVEVHRVPLGGVGPGKMLPEFLACCLISSIALGKLFNSVFTSSFENGGSC